MRQAVKNTHLELIYYPISLEEGTDRLSIEKIGNKALSLVNMHDMGLRVPPASIFTTDLCVYYNAHQQSLPDDFENSLKAAITSLEQQTGCVFGAHENPLIVSVRSGAAISMPGIMETILNIGLIPQHTKKYETQYRKLIHQYAEAVHGIYLMDTEDLTIDALLDLYHDEIGVDFPQDPFMQLKNAVIAVLNSATSQRAYRYCTIHNILEPAPTAVIIQQMVMSDVKNYSGLTGTGIIVSRDPNTAQAGMIGEFIQNASGSDLVSGRVTPQKIQNFQTAFGNNYSLLEDAAQKLEAHHTAPVEIEFTIVDDIVYFLQSRKVKLSDIAALEMAGHFYRENIIDEKTALLKVSPQNIERQLHPQVIETKNLVVCGAGIPASPGVATGHLVFTSEEAIQYAAEEKNVILMRHDTSPNDIQGMFAANGIITARGGMTSHAAVSARGMGRPCVTGVTGLEIDYQAEKCNFKDITFRKHDLISVDGTTGKIYPKYVPVHMPELSGAFRTINQLAQKNSRMQVRTNADNLNKLRIADDFGYDGIGLLRTETSFLKGKSKLVIQKLIINQILKQQLTINVNDLITEQTDYFTHIFQAAENRPVTIRLLDPPLQEIFPKSDSEVKDLAHILGVKNSELRQIISDMTENNPTIGWRGCRLGILYPEIYKLQAEIILKSHAASRSQTDVEIMVPFVSFVSEFITIKQQILDVYNKLKQEFATLEKPKIGIMIELPRAALCAGALALQADFLSFGTNDLTQTVLGISRDDAPHFMQDYLRRGLVPFDPFISMDLEGVGVLIQTAVIGARNTNPNIMIGLCGEHGADPNCVNFCENIGIDYLSCSPYRIPSARLAAAQAVILKQIEA